MVLQRSERAYLAASSFFASSFLPSSFFSSPFFSAFLPAFFADF